MGLSAIAAPSLAGRAARSVIAAISAAVAGRGRLCPVAWSVYVARCADGTLYTGVAVDVAARIAKHDAGKGARYTRGRGPLVVCGVRRCRTQGAALRLELAVKRLDRAAKEELADPKRFGAFARAVARARRIARACAEPAVERHRPLSARARTPGTG